MQAKVNTKNFIRYDEGAERYSMSKHSFMKLAQDARAVYKIRHDKKEENELLYIKKYLTF